MVVIGIQTCLTESIQEHTGTPIIMLFRSIPSLFVISCCNAVPNCYSSPRGSVLFLFQRGCVLFLQSLADAVVPDDARAVPARHAGLLPQSRQL